MNKTFFLIIAIHFTVLILGNSNAFGVNTESIPPEHVIHQIEEEAEDIIGGAIAIVSDDKIVYKKCFGRTQANGPLINEDTLFSLASVSKAIVATAMGVLKEKGIVNFKDTITINSKKICLENILSHTTGYRLRGDFEIEKGLSKKDLLLILRKEQQKNINPSPSFFYSNLLYSLVQEYLIKKGYKIGDLIKELGINLYTLPVKPENLAHPHCKQKEKLSFPSPYQKIVPASAGVFASLNGMIEFLQILLGNRKDIISQTTLDQLFTPVAEARDVFRWRILPFKDHEVDSGYCFGWRRLTVKGIKNSTLIFHSGFINGATAFIGIMPKHKAGIVILVNQSSPFALRNGLKIWKSIITPDTQD